MKTFVIGAIVGCGISVLVWLFLPAGVSEKLAKAEALRDAYHKMYDSTKHIADSLDTRVDTLLVAKENLKSEVSNLQGQIAVLKEEQKKEFFRIAGTFQPDTLVGEIKSAFPAFRNTMMGLIDITGKAGDPITCYYIPIGLVTSFIEDRKELVSLREINRKNEEIGLTQQSIITLQETITSLREQKAKEFERGMKDGMDRYDVLHKDYVDEVKTPKLNINLPTVGTMIGSAALGFILGDKIHKNP